MRKRDAGLIVAIVGLSLVVISLITLFNVEDALYTSTTGKASYCTPNCAGKACGADNGCEGICQTGTCPTGQTCSSGTCTVDVSCIPDCSDKVCGGDGCGGSCGNCTTGLACIGGTCVISEFECSDTIDNDADQLVDDKDPGCWTDLFNSASYDPARNDESDATTQCQDNLDNDGDNLIDENDPECLLEGNYDLTDNSEDDGANFGNSGVEWNSEKSFFSTSEFSVMTWMFLGALLAAIAGSIYYFVWKNKKGKKRKSKKRNKRARSSLFMID